MDDISSAVFQSLPALPSGVEDDDDDDLSDLREDQQFLRASLPPPSPKKKRKPRRSKLPQRPRSEDYGSPAVVALQPQHGHARALEHAAAGAALAGVMAGSLAHPRKKMMWQLAVVGIGAVYLGLLLYLWKRARDTEANLQETAEELRKIAAFLESSEALEDEKPLPRGGTVSQEAVDRMLGEDLSTTIEEIPLLPSSPPPAAPTATAAAAAAAPKRRKGVAKPAVINLDDEDDSGAAGPTSPPSRV